MDGRVVSHYRIIEPIGAGGMGVVYRAEDTRLGRPLALKFLPVTASHDQLAVERFEREARTASSLNHPNICTVYDIGEFEGQKFIAMEFLDGHSLEKQIAGKPLPVTTVLEFGAQIADALDIAHGQNILHRDIKPANIFVTRRGQVKVLDFGLAKLAQMEAASATTVAEHMVTTGGLAVGTIAYMSPEQARGEDLDHRSDLFSLGVVLHEMATGRQAFSGNTTAVVFDAILNRMPPPVATLNPDVPPELERIIDKALEKDRHLRYQSAADLKSDLQRLKRDRESGRVHASSAGTPAAGSRSGVHRAGPSAVVEPAAAAPGRPWQLVRLALATLAVVATGAGYIALRTGLPPSPGERPAEPAVAAPQPPTVPAETTSAVPPPTSTPPAAVSGPPTPGARTRKPTVAPLAAASADPDATAARPTPVETPPVPDVDPVATALESARPAVESGHYEQALTSLQAALGERPSSRSAPAASLLIARIYERQRRPDVALAAYNEVATRFPRDAAAAEAWSRMAALVQQTRQSDRTRLARGYLDQIVTNFPQSDAAARALAARAIIEDREDVKVNDPVLGRQVPAEIVSYRQLVERFPAARESEGAFWRLAKFYEDIKRHDLAAQAWVDLGTRFPSSRHDPWFEAGEVFEKRLKDKARAVDAYRRVPETSRRYRDAQRKLQ